MVAAAAVAVGGTAAAGQEHHVHVPAELGWASSSSLSPLMYLHVVCWKSVVCWKRIAPLSLHRSYTS